MAGAKEKKKFRLALVSMPWALFNRPSIQLGVLKGFLSREPWLKVHCLHPFLEVAKEIEPETYRRISLDGWSGEALYAPLVLPERMDPARRLYQRQLSSAPDYDQTHALVSRQLERFVDQVNWNDFDLVGFSVCFFQLMPTLAAIRMIRRKAPGIRVVVGGSLFSPETGARLLERFPLIDHVVCGEGEATMLALCRALSEGAPAAGVLVAEGQLPLASLPSPDFDDYFTQVAGFFAAAPFIPEIPLEFSRGCWWNRCRFCNLNLQWHGYRRFRAEEVFARVMREAKRGVLDFAFTDNVLPRDEAGRFFDLAAATEADFSFFAEIRAEQRGELARFRRGGLNEIQVGIEALSDSLLRRMGKGTSVLANLAVMKKAKECGIRLSGNLICEFPGSVPDEVEETLDTLDLAWPYDPLDAAGFFLGDGSPIAAKPHAYGVRAVLPHRAYAALLGYDLARDLALPVRGYRGDRAGQKRLWRPVREKIRAWRRYHHTRRRKGLRGCSLSYRDGGSFLMIRQEIEGGEPLLHRLKGLSREIYLAGDDVCRIDELLAARPGLDPDRLSAFLREMAAKKLICLRDDRFLSLAVRARGGNP